VPLIGTLGTLGILGILESPLSALEQCGRTRNIPSALFTIYHLPSAPPSAEVLNPE